MAHDINALVEMKDHTNNLGVNSYKWFFMNLENNWISKTDGTKRNVQILENYNEDAKHFIVVQLYFMNNEAALDLMEELGINEPKYFPERFDEMDKDL